MVQQLVVPAATALLRDFVNTRDVETGEEALTSPDALERWLVRRELIEPTARASASDLEGALRLREDLRAVLIGHHDGVRSGAYDALEADCRHYPVHVSVGVGVPRLEPLGDGASRGLARVVAAIVESGTEGSWSRLKVCPEETCQWAFVDTSKNRSRTWCTMRICGNRSKTRSYRARKRAGEEAEPAGAETGGADMEPRDAGTTSRD